MCLNVQWPQEALEISLLGQEYLTMRNSVQQNQKNEKHVLRFFYMGPYNQFRSSRWLLFLEWRTKLVDSTGDVNEIVSIAIGDLFWQNGSPSAIT